MTRAAFLLLVTFTSLWAFVRPPEVLEDGPAHPAVVSRKMVRAEVTPIREDVQSPAVLPTLFRFEAAPSQAARPVISSSEVSSDYIARRSAHLPQGPPVAG